MDKDLEAVAIQLFVTLATPRSLTCLILMRHGEWDQLARLTADPSHYLDTVTGVYRYSLDAQATDFLRKYPGLGTSWDRKKVAEATFFSCEDQCCSTNYRLQLYQHLPLGESRLAERTLEILSRARKVAGRILGPVPDSLEFGIGPGTAFELRGTTFSTLGDKVSTTPHITQSCVNVFLHTYNDTFIERTRSELGLPHHAIVAGNRFATVPKDSKTDRGICIEPFGNLAVQLGIGRYLKGRLSLVGLHVSPSGDSGSPIDFRVSRPDAQLIHRNLSREASLTSKFATIDLSNASDTVSRELVRLVIPDEWYSLLDAARSPKTLLGNKWYRLEKFSSMGNGFTFELETLLFAAILAAGCNLKIGSDLYVFGDDIILPNEMYELASCLLEACGFTVNTRKSFHTGSFRESCGGDYFCGFDVRSLFVKEEPSGPAFWVSLHNALRSRLSIRQSRIVLERCTRPIPSMLRVYGPQRLGDTVLHSTTRVKVDRKLPHMPRVRGIVAVPRFVPLDRYGGFTYLLAVMGCRSRGLALRKQVSGWKRVWLSIA